MLKKAREKKRTRMIKVLVSEMELVQIRAAAEAYGIGISPFLRTLGLKWLRGEVIDVKPRPDREDMF